MRMDNAPPHQFSQIILIVIAGFAFFFCNLAGVRLTADTLSEEKRNGTLGLLFLTNLRGLDVVGGDVVEVAPPFDPSGLTALAGATMLFEILCLMADAVASRR